MSTEASGREGGWGALPAPALLALRAAAVLGERFSLEALAALTEQSPLRALEALQLAVDAGVPLTERDDGATGEFALPEALVRSLRNGTLPALARVWRTRAAQLGLAASERAAREAASEAPRRAPPESPSPSPSPSPSEAPREAPTTAPASDEGAVRHAAPRVGRRFVAEHPRDYDAIFGAARAANDASGEAEPLAAAPSTASASAPAPFGAPPPPPTASDALGRDRGASFGARPPAPGVEPAPAPERAAEGTEFSPPERAARGLREDRPVGLASEGRGAPRRPDARPTGLAAEADVARLVADAQRAVDAGEAVEAVALLRAALARLASLPNTPERRRLRARLTSELGRTQWQCAGPGEDFVLPAALETLRAAEALLAPEDPPALWASVLTAIAGAAYDLGDLPALETALDALTRASRVLTASGDPFSAARLLNDQAAVWVRLGDPVRAAYLLERSRAVFEERADRDRTALREMAETDHLLARLPLHAPVRAGREADALAMGLARALSAEAAFKRLGDRRELARVWETLARLELWAGHAERAEERLAAALEAQESAGDVLGLARTTAALAEVRQRTGHHAEALKLLADSVVFNMEKGSPLGLLFNRRALEGLARDSSDPEERAAVARVAEELAAAEEILAKPRTPPRR